MKAEEQKLFEEFMQFKQFKEQLDSNTKDEPSKKKKTKSRKYSMRPDGRYCTQITVGYDEDTGSPIRKTVYGKTIAEIDDKVSELRIEKQRGTKFSRHNITVKQYRNSCYESKKMSISIKTIRMYDTVFNNYFSTIDDLKVREVELEDLQSVINANKAKKRTCQKIRMVFNEIFKSAVSERIIFYNPVDGIVIPRYKATERRPLTSDEDYLTEATVFTDREEAFIWAIKYFGLRKEEALALEKNDFDFKHDKLCIRHALIFDNNKPILKETKNGDERYLPIIPDVKKFYKFYTSNLETQYLFMNIQNDKRITDTGYKKMWNSIINKLNKKATQCKMKVEDDLTAHIFRHNYACMLMYAGIDMKERQYLLGHKTIAMTMDIYTHIDVKQMSASGRLISYTTELNEKRSAK